MREVDDPLTAQALDHAVGVHCGNAERVADLLLRQRQAALSVGGEADNRGTNVELA